MIAFVIRMIPHKYCICDCSENVYNDASSTYQSTDMTESRFEHHPIGICSPSSPRHELPSTAALAQSVSRAPPRVDRDVSYSWAAGGGVKLLKCPCCNWHYKYRETLEIHMREKHAHPATGDDDTAATVRYDPLAWQRNG